jgi:hypothetical protein
MGEGVAYSGLHGVYSCTQAVEEGGGGWVMGGVLGSAQGGGGALVYG